MSAKMIVELGVLKKLFSGLRVLNNEARIRFAEKGFEAYTVEPYNVSFAKARIPENTCEAYVADEDEVGLNIDRVLKILRFGRATDTAELSLNDKATLKFGSAEYTMTTFDPDIVKLLDISNLELPAEIKLSAEEFKRAIQAINRISDFATFLADGEKFIIEAKGDVERIKVDFSNYIIEYNKEKATANFSTEYLKAFTSILGKDDSVKIRMGNDLPVELNFNIEDSLFITYVLAPRVIIEE